MKRILSVLIVTIMLLSIAMCGAQAEKEVKVKSIKPADKKIVLAPDTTWQAEVTVLPENAANKELKWKSSNEKVATVDENGLITGHKKGNCKITATAADGSKKKAAITVQVKNYEVVIKGQQAVHVNFDTTDAYTESGLQIGNYSIKSVYSRTVKFVNDVVTSAGERQLKPVKTGEGSVNIVEKDNKKTKKSKHSVYVAQSAIRKVEPQSFEGNKYEVVMERCAWPDAKKKCESNGGHLVTLGSAKERNFVEKLAQTGEYWIGLSRDKTGNFCWVTGEPLVYTYWNANEPNNYKGEGWPGENVVAMTPMWNDYYETNTLNITGFICEYEGAGEEEQDV